MDVSRVVVTRYTLHVLHDTIACLFRVHMTPALSSHVRQSVQRIDTSPDAQPAEPPVRRNYDALARETERGFAVRRGLLACLRSPLATRPSSTQVPTNVVPSAKAFMLKKIPCADHTLLHCCSHLMKYPVRWALCHVLLAVLHLKTGVHPIVIVSLGADTATPVPKMVPPQVFLTFPSRLSRNVRMRSNPTRRHSYR